MASPPVQTRYPRRFWLDDGMGRWHNLAVQVQVPRHQVAIYLTEDSRMKKWFLLSLLICSTIAFGQAASSSTPQDLSTLNGRPEPPMLGIHWARGFDPFARVNEAHGQAGRKVKNPDMTYHGGKIMPTANTQAIFWGTSWAGYTGDEMTGMDSWYAGFGGSNYAQTSDEYTGTNGQVTAATSHIAHLVDTSPASGGGSTSAILAEVCKMVPSPDSTGNGYYAVYVDLPRGHAGYCAYHSVGTCNGQLVQFAFFWKLDGDAGCDPQSTVTGESQGLAALANVSGHELSEARTDPASGGWYDSSGQENGDKCAWTFNVPYVTFSNHTQWKIQGEWSNAAYNNGTGYPNSSGQRGCLDGF